MRRIATILLAAALLGFAGVRIRRALASPEQTLRWTLSELAEDFNAGDVGSVASGFHRDFRDESSGAGFDDVGAALRGLYLQERDKTGFLLRVELPEDLLSVEVAEGANSATVEATARFFRMRGGAQEPWWDAQARLTFVRQSGRWRIAESSRVNHGDRD